MATMNEETLDLSRSTLNAVPSAHQTSSWRNLFKKDLDHKLSFHAHVRDATNGVVTLPQEALESGLKQWENCLVGWFIGDAPDFRLVAATVNKIWGKRSPITLAKKGHLFIFHFSDSKLMEWVLENGPWFINKKLLVVQRWSPELSGGKINLKKVPLWCVLRNVPMHLYNNTCLSYIASAIGKPLYMDKGTTNQSHLDFARVCIEVCYEDKIPQSLKVDAGQGHIVDIQVVVPWKPDKCPSCQVFGHICKQKSEVLNEQGAEKRATPEEECSGAQQLTHEEEQGASSPEPSSMGEHHVEVPVEDSKNQKQLISETSNHESTPCTPLPPANDTIAGIHQQQTCHVPPTYSRAKERKKEQHNCISSSDDDSMFPELKTVELSKLRDQAPHSQTGTSHVAIKNKQAKKRGKGPSAQPSDP